jgi:hypothetical protein
VWFLALKSIDLADNIYKWAYKQGFALVKLQLDFKGDIMKFLQGSQ